MDEYATALVEYALALDCVHNDLSEWGLELETMEPEVRAASLMLPHSRVAAAYRVASRTGKNVPLPPDPHNCARHPLACGKWKKKG